MPVSALERKMGAKLRQDLENRAGVAAVAAAAGGGGSKERKPGGGETHPLAKAEALYREGVQNVKVGEQREAIAAFSRAIFLVPDEPLPYVARGEAFAAICDFRSAVSNFRKALTLLRDPAVTEDVQTRAAHLTDAMGVACLRRGEAKRAMYFFGEAIEARDEPVFELHRCLALIALERSREAEVALTALLHVAREAEAAAASSPATTRAGGDATPVDQQSNAGVRSSKASDAASAVSSAAPSGAGESGASAAAGSGASGQPSEHADGGSDDDMDGNASVASSTSSEADVDEEAAANLRKAQLAVDAEARVLLVHIALKTGDFAKARALLESCLQRHYTHPRVQDMEQRFDEAFQRLRGNAEEALDCDGLTRCITCFPDDADLYRARALAYINRKAYTLAVQDLFSCLQKSGGSSPVASALMASTLATVADELAGAEDYAAAANYYGESLKWDTTSADVYIARGDCLVQLARHEGALADYKSALGIDPTSTLVRARLASLHDTWGMILYNQARYELAAAEFGRAVGYNDKDPAVYYHRAVVRMMLKDNVSAARDLLRCRNLGATDPNILKLVQQVCGPSSRAPLAKQKQQAHDATGATSPSLMRPAGQEATTNRAAQKRSLGARLGLALHAANLLRGVKDPEALEKVTNAETSVAGLRGDRGSLLEQQYNPTLIRAAAAPKPPKPKAEAIAAYPANAKQVSAAPNDVGSSASLGHRGSTDSCSGNPRSSQPASAPATRGGRGDAHKPHGAPDRVWGSSGVIAGSRLDRVQVSKAQRVPSKYVAQQRERSRKEGDQRMAEELELERCRQAKLAMGQSGVPPPVPAVVAQRKQKRARVQPRGGGEDAARSIGQLEDLLTSKHQAPRAPSPSTVGRLGL